MTDSADSELEPSHNIISLADIPKSRPESRSRSKPAANNHAKPSRQVHKQVTFDRRELNQILRIYGFKVAAGEWRDYAIDHLNERAVFSVYRKTSEVPLFQIEKNPKLANRQGAYRVISVAGQVLKRGSDLRQVLLVFEKKPKLRVL